MLQRLNRSLKATSCLSTPEMDEPVLSPAGFCQPEPTNASAKPAANPTRKPNASQRVPKQAPHHQNRNGNGRNQWQAAPVVYPQVPEPIYIEANHPPGIPPYQCVPPLPGIPYFQPSLMGPFPFPPPPLGVMPPYRPAQAWIRGPPAPHPPGAQFALSNIGSVRPRTSSPLPRPRLHKAAASQEQERDYARWMKRLEEGSKDGTCLPLAEHRLSMNNNVYVQQAPVVPPCFVPMRCELVRIPVGFLPNGCYGPIQPPVFQCPPPQVMFPGSGVPISQFAVMHAPMPLSHEYSETNV